MTGPRTREPTVPARAGNGCSFPTAAGPSPCCPAGASPARGRPPLTQNGRTAYLLADQMNHGRPYRSFALVNSAALGNGYWQYYMTLLTAPAEVFPQALPQMTEIWQPWSISQGEMNRRTAQAMLTMQETNRIMQSTSEGRRTTEWHQHLTGMTLQGYSLFERFPGRYRVVRASDLK